MYTMQACPMSDTLLSCANSTTIAQPGGHYSHVCIGGGIAYISGQLPLDRHGNMVSTTDVGRQIDQVLQNLDACLLAAGSDRHHLLQVRVYIQDMADWPEFDKRYRDWIGDHKPARCVAGVASLHYGAAIELEATAMIHTAG